MEQVIVQLPLSGGQIYTLPYPVLPAVEQPEESAVQDKNLNLRQQQALEALFIFKQATADLLLEYLRLSPNSLRHLQKLLYALHPEQKELRYVEFVTPPKPKDVRFGSSPTIYTLGRRGHAYLKNRAFRLAGTEQPKTE